MSPAVSVNLFSNFTGYFFAEKIIDAKDAGKDNAMR